MTVNVKKSFIGIKPKEKQKAVFICQINESCLKLIKCLTEGNTFSLIDAYFEATPKDLNNKDLSEILNQGLKRLDYKNNPVIISLARGFATLRFLKIPSQSQQETERMISLQAAVLLPYPAKELITGYQTILTDKDGYAHINLIIVHQETIRKQLNFLAGLNIKNYALTLNSCGISSLYSHFNPRENGPVMLVDLDLDCAELTIVSQKKLLFSRSFKFDITEPQWQDLLIEQVAKTRDSYLREISKEDIIKIVVLIPDKYLPENWDFVSQRTGLATAGFTYLEKLSCPEDVLHKVSSYPCSFAGLIGLGLEHIPESLNLLPLELKEKKKELLKRREYIYQAGCIFLVIFLFALGTIRSLDNKTRYLQRLKSELNKHGQEARKLGDIDKRFKFLEKRKQKKPLALDIVYELNRIFPAQVSLNNLNYEEGKQVILRGETSELNSLFDLVTQMEKSPVFKGFLIKIRYVTKKRTQSGEITDFEILCSRE